MKKFLIKIFSRSIRYIFSEHYDDFKSFVREARAYDYKVTIKKIYYPDFYNNLTSNICMAYQGGTYYLKLRGIKEDLYDITCNVMLGRFDPTNPKEIERCQQIIINDLEVAAVNFII